LRDATKGAVLADSEEGQKDVSLRINTNLPAMTALRNLTNTNSDMAVNVNRLSTGLRINTAADDAAGLVISESMRAQIKGISQAMMNSQDAVNMTKTAEGGMEEVQRLLRNIRAIAVHAANTAVVDGPQLQADQGEIRSTLQSVDRIAQSTQWGTRKLLNGTAGTTANITATGDLNGATFTGSFSNMQIGSGTITVQRTTAATQTTLQTDRTFASAGTTVPAGSIVINGTTISSNGTSDTVQTMVDKINQQSANTGVVASIDTTGGTAAVKLQSVQYGSQFPVNYFDGSGILNSTPNPAPTTAGTDAVVSVTAPVIGPNGPTTATSVFRGGRAPGDSGLRLTDDAGNVITLTPGGNSNATLNAATAVGSLTSGNVRFQIGANADQSISFGLPDIRTTQLGTTLFAGKSLNTLDVTTQQGATEAIQIIDAAISQLGQMRGALGSFQKNFLESTVRSLSVANENLTASESSIRDLDVASEMTTYTKNQILQQGGIAILAQANQNPNQILKLLQG
jgi:flagellin